jgi:hypothetical protein
MMQQHAVNQLSQQHVHNILSNPIIITWEEIKNNKHRTILGYEKEFTFHIPDYFK